MPPLVAMIGAEIAASLAAVTLGDILVSVAISMAIGFVTRALMPHPKRGSFSRSSDLKSRDISRSFRQAITSRKIIYGENRVGGPMVRLPSSGDNEYFHVCIALAGHEVEEIGEVWFEDYPITDDMMDSSGNVITGRYSGVVRIKKHLGDQTTADADLVTETEVISTDIGYNTAYIYVRLKWDRDIFPGGVPNISAWVKGRKIVDPRDSTERWTTNVALMAHDYLQWDKYGFGANSDELDSTFSSAAANICEELVTTNDKTFTAIEIDDTLDLISLADDKLYLMTGDVVRLSGTLPAGLSTLTDYFVIPYQRIKSDDSECRFALASSLDNALAGVKVDITGTESGFTITKVQEPRYFGGGVIDTSVKLKDNLEDILSGMAGRTIYSGGSFKILAGTYNSPTVSLNENHIVGPVTVNTRLSRKDRFNTITGTYISPLNAGQPSDYPSVTNSSYVSADNGEEIIRELPQAFTQRPHTAQRIAKIELERARQEIVFKASFMLHAMQLRAGDTMLLTFERYGWEEKEFEVVEWSLGLGDGKDPKPVVNMTLRETDSSVFDWNSGEETSVDPAPNTNLPNPFTVDVVGGFSLDSISSLTQDGDKIYNVLASWDRHDDAFVNSGGRYEIEYKQSTETAYRSAAKLDGTVTSRFLPVLMPDVLYDIRIYAFNNLGVRSAVNEITGFKVGTSVTTDTEDWENETLSRSGDDWEVDTLTSEDWET